MRQSTPSQFDRCQHSIETRAYPQAPTVLMRRQCKKYALKGKRFCWIHIGEHRWGWVDK